MAQSTSSGHNQGIDREKGEFLATVTAPSADGDSATADTLAPAVGDGGGYAPDTLIDRYIVVGELGRGGMGVVLKAKDPDLKRTIAIKVLRSKDAPLSEDARKRMVREGQAIAQLSHPNVVSVYDVGIYDGDVFIAMEYVDGDTLTDWLDGDRSRDEILDVMVQAGRGLAAAHELGIVHRDFKADNTLIGKDGRVRVLDFGLARVVGDSDETALDLEATATELTTTVTAAGTLMGTPAYMAPEQFEGARTDQRADQFSFCVTLFEALIGHRPFAGDTLEALRDNVARGQRRPVPASARLPGWLSGLLDRGLSIDPDDRFPSMNAIVDELARSRRSAWPRVGLALGVVGLAAAAVFFATRGNKSPGESQAKPELVPSLREVVRESGVHLHPSLTADGEHVVYTDQTDILVRSLSEQGADKVVNLTEQFHPKAREPELSPDGKRVAFVADDKVYLLDVESGHARVVAERGFWPTFSPDGKQVAYVTEDRYDPWIAPDVALPELWRVELETGERHRIIDTELTATQPNWSPDGERLVFASDNHFMTVRPDGTDVKGTGITTATHPVWNATSDGLYVVEGRGGRYDIVLYPLDPATWAARSNEARSIVALSQNPPWHFDVSPDGRRFVASVHRSQHRTYRVGFDPDSGKATTAPQPFTDPRLGLISPSVSADGQWLVFTSLGDTDEDLYVMKIDGSEGRRVMRGNEYRRAPVFGPSGTAITYQGSVDNSWGIYRVDLDGSNHQALSVDPTHRFPNWSPDGKRLAVTASPDDSVNFPYIVVADEPWLPQGAKQHNPAFAGWRTGPWSPDGKFVALLSRSGLALLDVETRELTELGMRISDVAWLRDSRRVVAAAQSDLLLVDTASRQPTPIASLAPARATTLPSVEVTPDERSIFVSTNYEQASIWLVDLRPK